MNLLRTVFLSASVVFAVGCSSRDFVPAEAPVYEAETGGLSEGAVRSIMVQAAASRGWIIVSNTAQGLKLTYKGQTACATYAEGNVKVYQTGGDRDVSRWMLALNSEITKRLVAAQSH